MSQMNVDDLVKLLDSFSQQGGASIKPQFDGDKANFVVGNGETISKVVKNSVKESEDCVSCANIPNMNHIDIE